MAGLITNYIAHGSGAPGTAPSIPATETAFYYDDTGDQLYVWKPGSTAWHTAGGGGGTGAMVQIAQTTVGIGGAATIDFTSIAGTYTSLMLDIVARDSTAGTSDAFLYARFNNDSGSNYDSQYGVFDGTSSAASQVSAQTQGIAGFLMNGSSTASTVGITRFIIPYYATTSFHKAWVSDTFDYVASGARYVVGGRWRSTAAITRVTLLLGSGNFAQNSVATLWGIT